MKKLLTPLLVLLVYAACAQDDKVESIASGTRFIGGSISYTYDQTNEEIPNFGKSTSKSMSFGIGPVAGKYFRDNVAFGLLASYNFGKTENVYFNDDHAESSFQNVSVGAFIRKNYKIVPNFFFFIQGQASVSYGKSKSVSTSDIETEARSLGAGIYGSPGLQLFLGKKFSLETTLGTVGYSFRNTKYEESDYTTDSHSIDFLGGLSSVNFSVRYYIFP